MVQYPKAKHKQISTRRKYPPKKKGRGTQKKGGVSHADELAQALGRRRNLIFGQEQEQQQQQQQEQQQEQQKPVAAVAQQAQANINLIGTLNCLGDFSNPFEFKANGKNSKLERCWMYYLTQIGLNPYKDGNQILNNPLEFFTLTENQKPSDTNNDLDVIKKMTQLDNKFEETVERKNRIISHCSSSNSAGIKDYNLASNYKEKDPSEEHMIGIKLWDDICNTFMEIVTGLGDKELKEDLETAKKLCGDETVVKQVIEGVTADGGEKLPVINKNNTFVIACQEFTTKCEEYCNTTFKDKKYHMLKQEKVDEEDTQLAFISTSKLTKVDIDLDVNKFLMENDDKNKDIEKFNKAVKKTFKRTFVCSDDNNNVYVNIHAQHMSDPDSKPKTYDKQKEIYMAICEKLKEKEDHKDKTIYIMSDTNMEIPLDDKNKSTSTTRKIRSTMQAQMGKANVETIFEKDHIIQYTPDSNYDSCKMNNVSIYPPYKSGEYLPNKNWLSDHCLVYIELGNDSNKSTP